MLEEIGNYYSKENKIVYGSFSDNDYLPASGKLVYGLDGEDRIVGAQNGWRGTIALGGSGSDTYGLQQPNSFIIVSDHGGKKDNLDLSEISIKELDFHYIGNQGNIFIHRNDTVRGINYSIAFLVDPFGKRNKKYKIESFNFLDSNLTSRKLETRMKTSKRLSYTDASTEGYLNFSLLDISASDKAIEKLAANAKSNEKILKKISFFDNSNNFNDYFSSPLVASTLAKMKKKKIKAISKYLAQDDLSDLGLVKDLDLLEKLLKFNYFRELFSSANNKELDKIFAGSHVIDKVLDFLESGYSERLNNIASIELIKHMSTNGIYGDPDWLQPPYLELIKNDNHTLISKIISDVLHRQFGPKGDNDYVLLGEQLLIRGVSTKSSCKGKTTNAHEMDAKILSESKNLNFASVWQEFANPHLETDYLTGQYKGEKLSVAFDFQDFGLNLDITNWNPEDTSKGLNVNAKWKSIWNLGDGNDTISVGYSNGSIPRMSSYVSGGKGQDKVLIADDSSIVSISHYSIKYSLIAAKAEPIGIGIEHNGGAFTFIEPDVETIVFKGKSYSFTEFKADINDVLIDPRSGGDHGFIKFCA